MRKVYMLRMGTVGLGFAKKGASLNGLVLDKIVIENMEEENPVLLNVFLLNRSRHLNYEIICESFCNVAFLEFSTFEECIREDGADYEFIKQTYDSDIALEEEWAVKKCQECHEKHSLFNCPKLTFMPFRSLVYLRDSNQKYVPQVLPASLSSLEDYRRQYLLFVCNKRHRQAMVSPLKFWTKIFVPLGRVLTVKVDKMLSSLIRVKRGHNTRRVSHQIVREARTHLSNS